MKVTINLIEIMQIPICCRIRVSSARWLIHKDNSRKLFPSTFYKLGFNHAACRLGGGNSSEWTDFHERAIERGTARTSVEPEDDTFFTSVTPRFSHQKAKARIEYEIAHAFHGDLGSIIVDLLEFGIFPSLAFTSNLALSRIRRQHASIYIQRMRWVRGHLRETW